VGFGEIKTHSSQGYEAFVQGRTTVAGHAHPNISQALETSMPEATQERCSKALAVRTVRSTGDGGRGTESK
jgi:hypothetical protein